MPCSIVLVKLEMFAFVLYLYLVHLNVESYVVL